MKSEQAKGLLLLLLLLLLLNIVGSVSFLCYISSSKHGVCLSYHSRNLHDFFICWDRQFSSQTLTDQISNFMPSCCTPGQRASCRTLSRMVETRIHLDCLWNRKPSSSFREQKPRYRGLPFLRNVKCDSKNSIYICTYTYIYIHTYKGTFRSTR